MVNVAGRSKGCATCRRRKLKCDQTFPQCNRCTRIGEKCPGPRTGAFFVHSAVPDAQQVQRCRADAFDQLFVCHFIESFGFTQVQEPSGNWMAVLPDVLRGEDGILKSAIRSTSMITYGTWAQDVAIRSDSFQWYGRALRLFRDALAKQEKQKMEHIVCAAVMMLHFETWGNTAPKAWLNHLRGALSLLEQAGPAACQTGILHGIFQHLKMQVFIASMEDESLYIFSTSEDWRTVPYQSHSTELFDNLLHILFTMQQCLAMAKTCRETTGSLSDLNDKQDFSTLLQDTWRQLWEWNEMYASASPFLELRQLLVHLGKTGIAKQPPLESWMVPMMALLALFNASILVCSQLSKITQSPFDITSEKLTSLGMQAVVATELVNDVQGAAKDMGPLMMLPALKMVSVWSPDETVRRLAQNGLDADTAQRGVMQDIAQSRGYFAGVAQELYKKP